MPLAKVPAEIISRYTDIIRGFGYSSKKMSEGWETHLNHVSWMLDCIALGTVTGTKAHRWLGFVQGVLVSKGLIKVPDERELTRDLLRMADVG